MELKKEFVLRRIGEDLLLVPSGKSALDLNGMLTMNEAGAEIWEMLPQVKDEEEIIARLLEEYEVDEAELRQDVAEFMKNIRELGIL